MRHQPSVDRFLLPAAAVLTPALAAPFMDLFWLATNGWEALPRTGLVFFGVVGLLAALPVWTDFEWGPPRLHGASSS